MNIFYLYHLIDPRNQIPFYVGKGKNNRMYDHEKLTRRGVVPNNNKHLYYTILEIISSGNEILYKKVIDGLDEDSAWKKEAEEEVRLRNLGIDLCNIAKCGRGGDTLTNHPNKDEIFRQMVLNRPKKLSDSWKKNISLSGMGRVVTEKTRDKHRARMSGKQNPMLGKKHKLETKLLMAEKSRNRVVLAETRKKIGEIHKGKIVSEETRRKISDAKKGTTMSLETRNKMSRSHVGKKFPDDVKKKMSESLKGREFTEEHRRKISESAKLRVGSKNSNFRPICDENKTFIENGIKCGNSVNWIVNNLPKKMGRCRVVRYIKHRA